jgi:hypothetical protein
MFSFTDDLFHPGVLDDVRIAGEILSIGFVSCGDASAG